MAKAPYEFNSRDELIEYLRSEKTRIRANDFFSKRIPNIESVVREGVSGNTFRAFRKLPKKPSVVFREWGTKWITGAMERLQTINTEDEYEIFVLESTDNLRLEWLKIMSSELGFGIASKLCNLVLKKLPCLLNLDEDFKQRLIRLLHVPLDHYSIVGLRRLITNPKIPSNATMNFIKKPEEYLLLQRYIADVAKEAGVPAIYYDILAWDMAH
ncbi:hypothetical protein TAGGR_2332 [Thermodesulfovibrio aggregans]|uniref:Uncharacterized protein n=1 Tax=Thermodesulfovibrio aggregans TaxID=86166 RepID=A0A0U9HXM9_9BACT|nr:hypothetical protein [Thermodesulfovibrio aggregans]GAQ95439.1 hypothetical protein TAGGR_2332 [Thermodesulfovibrio aggregans]